MKDGTEGASVNLTEAADTEQKGRKTPREEKGKRKAKVPLSIRKIAKKLALQKTRETESEHLTFWQTTHSVLFAMLGVQKSSNAKRDFTKGKASHFIVIGIAFGIVFVLVVAFCVRLILSSAGV